MPFPQKLDLHSGIPYWLAINGLLGEDFPTLARSLPDEEVVIIGAGISGALVAHELCTAGFRCTMLDRRLLSSGSTWASTAQLNYELDISLMDLKRHYGEAAAVRIYEASLQAVARVGEVLKATGVEAGYERKDSLYLASDRRGAKDNVAEYKLRRQHGIPAALLDKEALTEEYGIDRRNAIRHSHAAQMDAYRAASGIIRHHVASGALKLYTRTEVIRMKCGKHVVDLLTRNDLRIRARHVICAPGYESETFLPKRVMNINSTYALVSQPLADEALWNGKALIWETARPYFYLRTTAEGRVMMGGGDVTFKNEQRRDALLKAKREELLAQCVKLFPHLKGISADFSWCGTFGETEDGLPYIGEYPGIKGVSFALGYGGNGTTFSMMAAEIIRNKLSGVADAREHLFGFRR